MGNIKSKTKIQEFPNSEAVKEFYQIYKKNPEDASLTHNIILDFFKAHYFEMVKFCRLNHLSEDQLWELVKTNGNSYNCICSRCHPEFYD